jgi:SAM-dependent methyltransferase
LDTKPEGYYLGTRHEMLRFIPEGVDTVLEVGCAAGGFGLQLKQRGIREVWGVEVVESAGQQARKVLDKVLIGDIADLIDELPVNYFDVVVSTTCLNTWSIRSPSWPASRAGSASVACWSVPFPTSAATTP